MIPYSKRNGHNITECKTEFKRDISGDIFDKPLNEKQIQCMAAESTTTHEFLIIDFRRAYTEYCGVKHVVKRLPHPFLQPLTKR